MNEQRFSSAAQIRKIDEAIEKKELDKKRILANVARHKAESPDEMTKRVRAYGTRKGLREARYFLTKRRRKDAALTKREDGKPAKCSALRVFEFICQQLKKSGNGYFYGVELGVEDIAADAGVTMREAFRIVDFLENSLPHSYIDQAKPRIDFEGARWPEVPAMRNPGIIYRLRVSGKRSRFVVTLPEADAYQEVLDDALHCYVETYHQRRMARVKQYLGRRRARRATISLPTAA